MPARAVSASMTLVAASEPAQHSPLLSLWATAAPAVYDQRAGPLQVLPLASCSVCQKTYKIISQLLECCLA